MPDEKAKEVKEAKKLTVESFEGNITLKKVRAFVSGEKQAVEVFDKISMAGGYGMFLLPAEKESVTLGMPKDPDQIAAINKVLGEVK